MSSQLKNSDLASESWYSKSGLNNDIVLSSRVRLARNLANFSFPVKLDIEEKKQVQSIVFDAFNHLDDADHYKCIDLSFLDSLGRKIMDERHCFDSNFDCGNSALVIRDDGCVSCTINMEDHIRISSFIAGFDINEALNIARKVDESLQNTIQFAANYDYGYLTQNIKDVGSGMKLSVQVHLPCLELLHSTEKVFENLGEKNICVKSCYGAGLGKVALGNFYQFSTVNSLSGSEFEQLTNLISFVNQLIRLEKESRAVCTASMESNIKDSVYRSIAIAKNSIFVSDREAINLIGNIKLGINSGIITGVDNSLLNALLYRIQNAHIEFLLSRIEFNFEQDIKDKTSKQIERLRALLLQEALEDLIIAL